MGTAVEALGATAERAITRATASALRSSGLSSMSSKKRGVADGWATWVSSCAMISLSLMPGVGAASR